MADAHICDYCNAVAPALPKDWDDRYRYIGIFNDPRTTWLQVRAGDEWGDFCCEACAVNWTTELLGNKVDERNKEKIGKKGWWKWLTG